MEYVELQLEALREIRGWGTWIVGIGGAVLGFSVALAEKKREKYVREIKCILLLGCVAFVCAITLITVVPSAIEMLPIKIDGGKEILSFDMSGVYGFRALGFVPLVIPFALLHFSVILIALILLTIFWRTIFE